MTARDYPVIHTGNSPQARMAGATAAGVESLEAIRDMYRAAGWTEREAGTEPWIAVARLDHAAAAAGIDYRDLAAMGPSPS